MQTISEKIKLAIKGLLKRGGYTYQDLAEALDVSLPTIRRILTKEDIGLDRLAAICDWLGVSLEELAAMGNQAPIKINYLTQEQENFFASFPDAYTYLRYLGRGMTPEEIESQYSISSKATKWYLTELKALGVIELAANDKVRFKIPWPTNWRFSGKLEKKFSRAIYRSATDCLLEKVSKHSGPYENADFFLMLDSIMISERSYNEYLEELRAIYLKYTTIGRYELKTMTNKKLRVASILYGIDRADFITAGMAQVKERK